MSASATHLPAGISGKLSFGALGFVLGIPLLNRLRRRHDSGGGSTTPTTNSVPPVPPGVAPADAETHHR